MISPWNLPVNLTFSPLAGIFAAGNRCMIKPSEHTPRTSELIAELVASTFDSEELAVVTGGPETGSKFSALPFDHLLFTGSTAVAPHILRAAADHLMSVTLELGGKSPVVIGASADLKKCAQSIMMGKLVNAGQACVSPDYVLVGKEMGFRNFSHQRAVYSQSRLDVMGMAGLRPPYGEKFDRFLKGIFK